MPEVQPATKQNLKSDNNDFKKSFGLSLALHAVVLSLFLIKLIYYSQPMIDLSQAINVSIGDFTESNRLPEKIEAQMAPAQEETLPPKKITPDTKQPIEKKEIAKTKLKEMAKPDTVSLTRNKQKAALDKLKKSSALEKIKQDLKNDSISKIKSQSAKNLGGKPRIIPAGSTLGGLDRLQANNYLHEIDQSIKQFWLLPQWLINKPLKAQVLVKFNMQGQILASKIISSSGNSSYDQYCLKAIENAAPFPQVPDKLTEKFSIDGVVIGFPE